MPNITIVSVGPAETKQSAKGTAYSMIELFYKDAKGGAKSKKIMSFNKKIYPVIAKASPGEQYDVTAEKQGDFWEWTAIERASETAAPTSQAVSSVRAYQKSDDRDRQIARSVALKTAVDYLGTCAGGKEDKSPERVLGLSVRFEEYLMKGAEVLVASELPEPPKAAATGDADFADDVPF